MADSRTARMAHAQRVGALVVVMIGSAATVAAQYGTDGAGCGSARLACKGMSQEVATLRPIVYDSHRMLGVFKRIKGRCRSQAL